MKISDINPYFIDAFLTCGQTYDNFVFTNCPVDFMRIAEAQLSIDNDDCNSCVVHISRKDEVLLDKLFYKCTSSYQLRAFARDYIDLLVMRELVKKIEDIGDLKHIEQHINALRNGDIDSAIDYHIEAPLPNHIIFLINAIRKTEIDFFLFNTDNTIIQSAINNFLSMRTPYSIKVFTNNERLPSYYDEAGTPIECPHDFINLNVYDFINDKENSSDDQEIPSYWT